MDYRGTFGLAMPGHVVHKFVQLSGAWLKKPSRFKGTDA